LDLKDPTIWAAIQGVHDQDDVLRAFAEHGGAYG
jgi:hypothetical protein